MSTSDKFLVAFLLVWNSLIIAFVLIPGLQVWGWFLLGVEVLLGVVEIISKVTTGATISTRFRRWANAHVWKASLLLGGLLLSMGLLVLHLAWK
jgi:hypothetical protein